MQERSTRGPFIYRIGDVVRLVGISPSTLKRLEAEGAIPRPVRLNGRQRRYSEADLAEIMLRFTSDSVLA